ncbi:MAG: glycosyl transferase family 1 [Bacteroidota bacterium]
MSKKILFLALAPNDRYKTDGVTSRMKAIDALFKDDPRTYLYISLSKNFKKYHNVTDTLEVYELNLFLHFFKIIKIFFSSPIVYSHSIYLLKNIWFLIPFYKGKFFLDAHGVVPEEIKYFKNNILSFWFMAFVEKLVFTKNNVTVICVTNTMQKYFRYKYPNFKGKFILYNIFPANLSPNSSFKDYNKDQSDSAITVIYSGGAASWQKIDLMLDTIEQNQANNIKYIILSLELKEFDKRIAARKINRENLQLKMVEPKELIDFYQKADFGFLLRDDNIVNQVASPTKLIEYLSYGIVPIVLAPNIGDYLNYGFEFLTLDKFDKLVKKPTTKSFKNISIAEDLLKKNGEINFKDKILYSP